MRVLLPAAVFSARIFAADLEVTLEIPRINVAEYHRPYVAIWVEKPDQTIAANLAVWYDQQTSKQEAGSTWLKDLRQWWRKSGRDLKMPVDGVSGATRPPGAHLVTFRTAKSALASLPPGSYQLVVEAAREVGGRELLRVPFQWPAPSAQPAAVKGAHELGQIKVNVRP
jgi:hypothetical protein